MPRFESGPLSAMRRALQALRSCWRSPTHEGVEVFVNGQSAGVQVVPPFRYDLRSLTQEGKNSLVIEVATTLERERGKTKNAAPTGITGEVALYG